MKSVEAPPKASTLIESMSDIGYTLETALADVVDNSITAGATAVSIYVDSAGADVKIGLLEERGRETLVELLARRHDSADGLQRVGAHWPPSR